jgi:hypothetical protein
MYLSMFACLLLTKVIGTSSNVVTPWPVSICRKNLNWELHAWQQTVQDFASLVPAFAVDFALDFLSDVIGHDGSHNILLSQK